MRNRRALGLMLAIVALILIVGIIKTSGGPPPATPNPAGSFSFAALGDAPYYIWEEWQFKIILQSLEANDLSAVIHVGDIFWRPCSDAMYMTTRDRFNGLRHPVIYTPGDNEWADCWERQTGSFAPLERLKRIREIFFATPSRSLGKKRIALASQGSELVENARWEERGVLFATVHLPGSKNATRPFPERTAADDEEVRRRTIGAAAWIRETFRHATTRNAAAAVIAFHANPGFEAAIDDPYRQAYEPFIVTLEEEVESFQKPVLIIQGDDHEYIVDYPLLRRTTGKRIANLARLQVPGSPEVGWVRVTVTPEAPAPFAFESYVVPWWKYW